MCPSILVKTLICASPGNQAWTKPSLMIRSAHGTKCLLRPLNTGNDLNIYQSWQPDLDLLSVGSWNIVLARATVLVQLRPLNTGNNLYLYQSWQPGLNLLYVGSWNIVLARATLKMPAPSLNSGNDLYFFNSWQPDLNLLSVGKWDGKQTMSYVWLWFSLFFLYKHLLSNNTNNLSKDVFYLKLFLIINRVQ